MHNSKVLVIGNNSYDTHLQASNYATQNKLTFNGMFDGDIKVGVTHTSIEDIEINRVFELITQFEKIEILEQTNFTDSLAAAQLRTLKKQLTMSDSNLEFIDNDKIVFFGCSHTEGIGHSSNETVYTSSFSKLLNKDYCVYGFPGKGNFALEEKLSSISVKNKKIIIQFTDMYRIRFYDQSCNSIIDKMGHEFSLKDMEFYTDEWLYTELLKIVDRVVARLRDANAEFLFFHLTHYHKLNFQIWEHMANYKEFCWVPDFIKDYVSDGHYGPKSHNMIAERLFDRWNKLYV